MRKKAILSVCVLAMALMMFTGCSNQESITYNGQEYILIEYNQDIMAYDYNSNEYIEVDTIAEVKSEQWGMITCDGDLFVEKNKLKEAEKYYKDDANYDWYITIEDDEKENTFELEVDDETWQEFYNLEKQEKDKYLFFDEIEKFATLFKKSKDGIVIARTELAFYQGDWYWRSEVINEEIERDDTWPEYVYEVPEELNKKIK